MLLDEYTKLRDELIEINPDIIFFDGLEDALIGICRRFNQPPVALYDYDKCIEILLEDGGSYNEVIEHLETNVLGTWVGENTPAFFKRTEE